MGHVFISYSHRDTGYAHGLADSLQRNGFDDWIDERLDYGSHWPHELQTRLYSCDAFILIMTPRSYASEWVQNELQRAKRNGKRPLVGPMDAHFPGGRKQMIPMPTMVLQMVIQPGSGNTKVAKALTACMIRRRVQGTAEAEIVLGFCRVEPVANGCADEFGSVIPRAAAHYFSIP